MADDGSPYGEWRDEIDRIDTELLALLNRRARLAQEIGKRKRARGEAIHVPERERVVLARLARLGGGPLSADAVADIFRTIIGHIRALEEHGEGEGRQ